MVYGHDGFAGELGHVIIRRENGRLCGCGRHGCLETYCSATGVARTAREFLTARTEPSLLRSIPAENITSKDVYDAAVQGDKLAQDIFDFTGNILGEASLWFCYSATSFPHKARVCRFWLLASISPAPQLSRPAF